jgi:hypothetical protein
MLVVVLSLQSSIYEIEIEKLMFSFMAMSGHTQHLLPYVVGMRWQALLDDDSGKMDTCSMRGSGNEACSKG